MKKSFIPSIENFLLIEGVMEHKPVVKVVVQFVYVIVDYHVSFVTEQFMD